MTSSVISDNSNEIKNKKRYSMTSSTISNESNHSNTSTLKRLSMANVNPNLCLNKNSIASANAKMNPIPNKPIVKMNPKRSSVVLTTKPKDHSKKGKNRNSLALNIAGSVVSDNGSHEYELPPSIPVIPEHPPQNKVTDPSSMKLLSVVAEDFMSPLTPYDYTPYASYVSPSLVSPTVPNGELIMEDVEPIEPPCMSPIITADIPITITSSPDANNVNLKRVSYIAGKAENKSSKAKNRISVSGNLSNSSVENVSDSFLREVNKNSSHAISKRSSAQILNKKKEKASKTSKKNKRKSIFSKIF